MFGEASSSSTLIMSTGSDLERRRSCLPFLRLLYGPLGRLKEFPLAGDDPLRLGDSLGYSLCVGVGGRTDINSNLAATSSSRMSMEKAEEALEAGAGDALSICSSVSASIGSIVLQGRGTPVKPRNFTAVVQGARPARRPTTTQPTARWVFHH